VIIFNGAFQFEKFKQGLKDADKGDATQYDRRFWANLRITNIQGTEMQVFINDYLLRNPEAPKDKMTLFYDVTINWSNVALRYGGEAKARISGSAFHPLMALRESVPDRFKESEKIIDADAVDVTDLGAIVFASDESEQISINMAPKTITSKDINEILNWLLQQGYIGGAKKDIETQIDYAKLVIKQKFGLVDTIPDNPFYGMISSAVDRYFENKK
jgi:hypothetical protein